MRKLLVWNAIGLCLLLGTVPGGISRGECSAWDLLKELIMIPGVSGHEGPVADFIQERVPAEFKPQRDRMHNLWFTAGSGRPHLVFVAHTDEIGFVVKGITPSGTLRISSRGGFMAQMYEGWAVVVHTKSGPVNGLVIPREEAPRGPEERVSFRTENVEVDLGVSTEDEARALGVETGDPITIRKKITQLSENLLAARAVDDRAGCAALLAAAQELSRKDFAGKTVTLLWDVQEETGLFGASRMAARLEADIVFPVDTFVSSAGPLDGKRFAHLRLGEGPVLRAVDSSSITPRFWLEKVRAVAAAHGIPLQMGNTRGGNDGSVFVPRGAVNIPLSWPSTYSHSFIEKIHREDLENLVRLIVALVRDW